MNIFEKLNVKYPIIQGGMEGIAKANLALAVSNAGGLGLIGTSGQNVSEFKQEIDLAMKSIDKSKSFGVNIVLNEDGIDDKIDYTISKKVPLVTISAGNPKNYIKKFKDAGILVLCLVGNSEMAVKCEEYGADGLIFSGSEAGGFISSVTTMAGLVPVVKSVNIPVISAGGYGDGSQLLAAQAMGAIGIQMGTRFLVAKESKISDNYKKLLINSKENSTVLIGENLGVSIRQISNNFTKNINSMENLNIGQLIDLYTKGMVVAVNEGNLEEGDFLCGMSVGMIEKEQTADEIIKEIIEEYNQAKDRLFSDQNFIK